MITEDVKRKLTGARGEKVIVAFNESKDNKTTVEDLPLNDAPAHYEYLASEAASKIMVGHRVTSKSSSGSKCLFTITPSTISLNSLLSALSFPI